MSGLVSDALRVLSLNASVVDLFLDLEAVVTLPSHAASEAALYELLSEALDALDVKSFRSVVVCGSSVPEAVTAEHNWNPLRLTRTEYRIWCRLVQHRRDLLLGFGDYGVVYPFERDTKGPVRPPSRIRLSTENDHVLYRAPPGNYKQLCSDVVRSYDFQPSLPAWSTDMLLDCSIGAVRTGNPTDWVARDTNYHCELTPRDAEEMLKLYGRSAEVTLGEPERVVWQQLKFDGGPP